MENLHEEIIGKLEAESDGLQSVYTTAEVKKAINFALVFSHNLCTQISNKYNEDDLTNEATVAAECCKEILGHADYNFVKGIIFKNS